jgi:hypothetical protein
MRDLGADERLVWVSPRHWVVLAPGFVVAIALVLVQIGRWPPFADDVRGYLPWGMPGDESRIFGGLRRVLDPSGDLIWVCADHYPVYDPGLPDLPPPG